MDASSTTAVADLIKHHGVAEKREAKRVNAMLVEMGDTVGTGATAAAAAAAFVLMVPNPGRRSKQSHVITTRFAYCSACDRCRPPPTRQQAHGLVAFPTFSRGDELMDSMSISSSRRPSPVHPPGCCRYIFFLISL